MNTSVRISPLPSPSPHPGVDVAGSTKQPVAPRRSFVEILREGAAAPRAAPAEKPPVAPRAQRPATDSLRALMAEAFEAERSVDVVLEAAARRKTFSASELLSLQVQVFRYSQTVEVISRTTDKLVSAVKQTLGTQV